MKKLVILVLTFCFTVGIVGNLNETVYAKENLNTYTVEINEYTQNQKSQIKMTNYVFSQEELKNTPYYGHQVEIIEGELYVDKSIILTVKIWILMSGYPLLAGYITKSGTVTLTGKYPQGFTSSLINAVLNAWNRYGDMVDAYANTAQNLVSIKLANGNECVPTSATTYACKWSV